MIERGQPWAAYTIGGRAVRVQFLDPVTAFEVEPEIIGRIGPVAALVMADPGRVVQALAGGVRTSTPLDVAQTIAARLRALGLGVARMAESPEWIAAMFGRLVFGRVTVDGEHVRRFADMDRLGVTCSLRWQMLGLAVAQTFRPLWGRSQYNPQAPRAQDYGVPKPSTPIASQWSAELARQGYASSMREILDTWTAHELLDAVDSAAHAAESARRANEAARQAQPR